MVGGQTGQTVCLSKFDLFDLFDKSCLSNRANSNIIKIVDIDSDGDLDVLVANDGNNAMYMNEGVWAIDGDGNRQLASWELVKACPCTPGACRHGGVIWPDDACSWPPCAWQCGDHLGGDGETACTVEAAGCRAPIGGDFITRTGSSYGLEVVDMSAPSRGGLSGPCIPYRFSMKIYFALWGSIVRC